MNFAEGSGIALWNVMAVLLAVLGVLLLPTFEESGIFMVPFIGSGLSIFFSVYAAYEVNKR